MTKTEYTFTITMRFAKKQVVLNIGNVILKTNGNLNICF